jgi:hypothetical protein
MKTLVIGLLSFLQLQVIAEGCSGPRLIVGNFSSRSPSLDPIGIRYFPKYSTYTVTAVGNQVCSYAITKFRVYLNNILIAKNDTSGGFHLSFTLGAYPGNYMVEVELGIIAWNEVWLFEIADNPLGLTELSEKQSLFVFPNPAQSFINIQSKKEITTLDLFDSLGNLIRSQTCSTQSIELPLGDYPPGIYFLHVAILGEQTTIKKIVIQ